MDEETRAALDLTRDDLIRMREAASPGRVGKRSRDSNRSAAEIVRETEEQHDTASRAGLRLDWHLNSVVITGGRFGEYGPNQVKMDASAAKSLSIGPV